MGVLAHQPMNRERNHAASSILSHPIGPRQERRGSEKSPPSFAASQNIFCQTPAVRKKSPAALNSPHPAPARRTVNRSKVEIVGVASFDSADNLQTRPPMRRETTAPQAPSLSPPIASRRRTLLSSFQRLSIQLADLPMAMPVCGCADDPKFTIAHPAFSFSSLFPPPAPQAPSLSPPIASRPGHVPACSFALKSSPLEVNVRSDSSDTTPLATSDINSQPRIHMGKTIEFPDPLFAEIDGYAHRVAASPITVIRQAWEEFRHRHPPESDTTAVRKPDTEELLSMVRVLRGSISLPADVDDKTLITEARLEKHGPL
ncbi:MAG: hypothetical protein NTW21_13950 [Verrucomicrobia bacterium]|nr:hypothetical protein [Verrucomicrobiota bacterium]